jgi:Sap, sulfolipid-1-addressing protein
MADLFALAVASAFWPALIAVVLISLRAPHPGRLMASFLAAGLLTTTTIGLAIIYALRRSPATSDPDRTFGPVAQIVVGSLAVLGAAALAHRHSRARPKQDDARPAWIERMLERGAPLAFVAGVVLNVIPGVLPFVALKDIAEMNLGAAATVATVIGFYLVMFVFIEIPLAGYLVAPARTARATGRFNAWIDRNSHSLAVAALGIAGVYLIVRGIAELTG